jgi:hypothetical protein
MTTLTLVLLGILVLVAAFIAYVAAKSGDFKIERSARIRASADAVFARINDLREFNSWNPFAAADPGEFAKGLASLKNLVERETAAA